MSIVSEAIWAPLPTTTRGQPTPLSADPKGERIAYASNKSIFLRSIDHPEISKQYTAHTAQTTVARFSPSGYWVASGDISGQVRVWDAVGEGNTKGEYSIIAGRINDLAWDGDSQRIIAVGDGKERFGHCITADSGNSVGEISGHSSQINCVSVRQQRPLRAATGSDDTKVVFFHGAPFKYNASLQGNHNKFVFGTAFSPDGASLVSVGADRRIWLYDGKTGEEKQQVGAGEHTGSIFGVSWAKDSKQFATASADQTVKIWDAEAGKATQTFRMGPSGVPTVSHQQLGLVWPQNRADNLIISVDLAGNLNYLDPRAAEPVRVVTGHQGSITAAGVVEFADGKPTLYTGSYEGRVRAWDVTTGTASPIDGESHSNYVSGFSAAGPGRIYSIGWDDTLRGIDTATHSFSAGPAPKTAGQPKGIAHAGSDTILVATSNGVDVFSASSAAKSGDGVQAKGYSPTCIATPRAGSPNAAQVAVGGDDKHLRIFSLSSNGSTLSPTPTAEISTLSSAPSTLAFSPSGALLAVGLASGGISVFNTADWSLNTSRWSAHTARVTCLAWSAHGEYAVSGGLDTNVFVWSLKKPGKRVRAAGAHKDGVGGVVWVGGEGATAEVLSVGADAAVKRWRVEGLE